MLAKIGITFLLLCGSLFYGISQDDTYIVYTDSTYYIWETFDSFYGQSDEGISYIQNYVQRENRNWLFYLLSFCTLLYASIKYSFRKEFDASIKAFTNINIAQQLFRDREIKRNIPAILMNLGFVLSLSILIFHILKYLELSLAPQPLSSIFIIAGLLIILVVIRIAGIHFLGWLFPLKNKTDYYAFNLMLANRICGVILLPLLFIISFAGGSVSKPFLILALVIFFLITVYKIFRGFELVKDIYQLHKVHLILYICTFEISPVLLIAKFLSENLHRYII